MSMSSESQNRLFHELGEIKGIVQGYEARFDAIEAQIVATNITVSANTERIGKLEAALHTAKVIGGVVVSLVAALIAAVVSLWKGS